MNNNKKFSLIIIMVLVVQFCISPYSIIYSVEEETNLEIGGNILEPGKSTSLDELSKKGLIDDENYKIREEIRKNSKLFLEEDISFSEKMSEIMDGFDSVEEMLADDDSSTKVLALLKEEKNIDNVVKTIDDFNAFNNILSTANGIMYASKNSNIDIPKNIADIIIIMDDIIIESQYIPNPSLSGNLKAIMLDEETVSLRWQHDSKWIPKYGYNLYRIIGDKAELLERGIGSQEKINNGLEDYVSKIASEDNYIDLKDKDEYKKTLKKGFASVLNEAVVTDEKANILGFNNVKEFNNFSNDKIVSERQSLIVVKGDDAFTIERATSFIDKEKTTYDKDKMGLSSVLSGRKMNNLAKDMMLGNDKGSVANLPDAIKERQINLNTISLSEIPSIGDADLKLRKETLTKIIDARSIISSGSDTDFELAKSMGLAYIDDLDNTGAEFALYVLQPINDLSEQFDTDTLVETATEYALEKGLLIYESEESNNELEIIKPLEKNILNVSVVDFNEEVPIIAPANIEGYGVDNSAVIRWDVSDDETSKNIVSGYNIYRRKNRESKFRKINNEPVIIAHFTKNIDNNLLTFENPIFYRDTDIKNGDRVEYKVEAIDVFGRTSGMSEDKCIIQKVVKTKLPKTPIIEQPYISTKVTGDKVQAWLKNAVNKVEENNETSIILPISTSGENEDIVMFNIYRSKTYGKEKYSVPEKVESLEAIGKNIKIDDFVDQKGKIIESDKIKSYIKNDKEFKGKKISDIEITKEINKKLNDGKLSIRYLPGTYYNDTDIDKGYYYKYWIAAVDSWGNESAWTEPVIIGYESDDFNGVINHATIDVVENPRLDMRGIVPGFAEERISDIKNSMRISDIGRINTDINFDAIEGSFSERLEGIRNIGRNNNEVTINNNYYGLSLTNSTMKDVKIVPEAISKNYLNLPDVKQVFNMVGYDLEDYNPDGSLNVAWNKYQGDNLAEYAVYRGIIENIDDNQLDEMTKAEVLESFSRCELVTKTNENIFLDNPVEIDNNDKLIYIVTLIPKDTSIVTGFNHIADIRDDHAVGGWVRLDWQAPREWQQVGSYKIYKAVLDDINDDLEMESLNWTLLENDCKYTHYFESVDQVTEQFLAYKIIPVSLWGIEGEPIYKDIRVPALLPPAMPEVLIPYAKPGTVEVRFTAVNDAKKYTIYRTTIKKINNKTIEDYITDRTVGSTLGIELNRDALENNFDIASSISDIESLGNIRENAGTINLLDRNIVSNYTSSELLTINQPIDATSYLEKLSGITKNEKIDLIKDMIDQYGVLSVADYSDLSYELAAIVSWDEIANINSNDSYKPGDVITYYDDDVKFGEEYYYTVTASNTDLESYKPEPMKGYCRKGEPFKAPTNVLIENDIAVDDNGEKYWVSDISWNHVNMAGFTQEEVINDYLVGYIVYRSTKLGGNYYQVSGVIKDNHYVDSSSYALQKYYYKVRAIDIAGLLSDFSKASTQSEVIADNLGFKAVSLKNAENIGLSLSDYNNRNNTSNISRLTRRLKNDLNKFLKNATKSQIEEAIETVENDKSLPKDLKKSVIDILKAKQKRAPISISFLNTSVVEDITKTSMYAALGITVPSASRDIEISTETLDIIGESALIEAYINEDFREEFEAQTEILGFEPQIATIDMPGGWVNINDDSTEPEVDYREMGSINNVVPVPDMASTLRVKEIYDQIKETNDYQMGEYLIKDISIHTVKKDGYHGAALSGRGNIYLGQSQVKIPVIFKIDSSHRTQEEYRDKISLAMYPYKDIDTGLYISSLDIDIDIHGADEGKISGYIEGHDGKLLINDLNKVYFENAKINSKAQIEMNHFPSFVYGEYRVFDVTKAIACLDLMNKSFESPQAYITDNHGKFPINLEYGKIDTCFNFPTIDNKGLVFNFDKLGLIPIDNYCSGTRSAQVCAIYNSGSDYNISTNEIDNIGEDLQGLYGTIYVTEEPTTAKIVVPAGMGIRVNEANLYLFGDKAHPRYTDFTGEVLLPFFDAPDEFLEGGVAQHLTREDVDGISDTIISLYDEDSDFADIYLDEMVINVFDRLKNGGLMIIGGNTYGLSSIPFDLHGVNLDGGFILENAALEPTMVGNYYIHGGIYNENVDSDVEQNMTEAKLFTKLVEQSMIVQSDDISVDLSTRLKTTSSPLGLWYSDNAWKGIIIDEGLVSISSAIVKTNEGNGVNKPITFTLKQGEMIYDRNGFMYQNALEVKEGENVPISFGRMFGGFTDAKLKSLSIDMYNNKFDFTMNGKVLIKSFNNEEFYFRMQTEVIDDAKVITANLLPKNIDLSLGRVNDKARVSMDIYGGYFDEEGVHIDGALLLSEFDDEDLTFNELIIPANQEEMIITRDSLSQGETLRKGTASFNKPYIVKFNGFDIELAYFDIYTILDNFRYARGVNGDNQKIYQSDIKIYGSTGLTDNMEKKSAERNAKFYIEDILGEGKLDYNRCIVHINMPNGDGMISGEVKASPSKQEGLLDGYSELVNDLDKLKNDNEKALNAAGDAKKALEDAGELLERLETLILDVNNIDVHIKTKAKRLIIEKIPDLVLDKELAKALIMEQARIIIDEANDLIDEYNKTAEEFEEYIETQLIPPSQYNGVRFERVDIINKSDYTGFFEEILKELENQLELGADKLLDYVDDYAFEFPSINDIHIPGLDIDLGEFDVANIIELDLADSAEIIDGAKEALDGTIDVFEGIGSGLNTLDRLLNNGIPPGMDVGEDGIVEFVASGDEVFSMVLGGGCDFLEGSNVKTLGRIGYKLDVRDTSSEDMYFYAFGIGYIATPDDPDAGIPLGLLELQNVVAVTGYNMKLPYSKVNGYEVGYGEDLINSIKDFKIDTNNGKESFFIASGDAYILVNRQMHVAALKKLRYIKESDGSFEMSGEFWGPKDLVQIAVPTPNNSQKQYGGASITYNARDNGYKLLTLVDNIPIEPSMSFKVGGNIGFDWSDDYWQFKMGYPETMHLIYAPLDLEGGFGLTLGTNPYSGNAVFATKVGLEVKNSFDVGIVYANVGASFLSEMGYTYWNIDEENLDFPWYEDGKTFEGIGAYVRFHGYMNGGIDAGRFGKRNIISATIDATADIINPREDIAYVINSDTGDFKAIRAKDENGNKICDKSTWHLYAGLRIRYNLDLWLCSYSDNFMYDMRMDF